MPRPASSGSRSAPPRPLLLLAAVIAVVLSLPARAQQPGIVWRQVNRTRTCDGFVNTTTATPALAQDVFPLYAAAAPDGAGIFAMGSAYAKAGAWKESAGASAAIGGPGIMLVIPSAGRLNAPASLASTLLSVPLTPEEQPRCTDTASAAAGGPPSAPLAARYGATLVTAAAVPGHPRTCHFQALVGGTTGTGEGPNNGTAREDAIADALVKSPSAPGDWAPVPFVGLGTRGAAYVIVPGPAVDANGTALPPTTLVVLFGGLFPNGTAIWNVSASPTSSAAVLAEFDEFPAAASFAVPDDCGGGGGGGGALVVTPLYARRQVAEHLRGRAFITLGSAPARGGVYLYGGCVGTEPGSAVPVRCFTDVWFTRDITNPDKWVRSTVALGGLGAFPVAPRPDLQRSILLEMPMAANLTDEMWGTFGNAFIQPATNTTLPASASPSPQMPAASGGPVSRVLRMGGGGVGGGAVVPSPSYSVPQPRSLGGPSAIPDPFGVAAAADDTVTVPSPTSSPSPDPDRMLPARNSMPLLLIGSQAAAWSSDGVVWSKLPGSMLLPHNPSTTPAEQRQFGWWRSVEGSASGTNHPSIYGGASLFLRGSDGLPVVAAVGRGETFWVGYMAVCETINSRFCPDGFFPKHVCAADALANRPTSVQCLPCRVCPAQTYMLSKCEPGVDTVCKSCDPLKDVPTRYLEQCSGNGTVDDPGAVDPEVDPSGRVDLLSAGVSLPWPLDEGLAESTATGATAGTLVVFGLVVAAAAAVRRLAASQPQLREQQHGNVNGGRTLAVAGGFGGRQGGPSAVSRLFGTLPPSQALAALVSVVVAVVGFAAHLTLGLVLATDPGSAGPSRSYADRYGICIVVYLLLRYAGAALAAVPFARAEQARARGLQRAFGPAEGGADARTGGGSTSSAAGRGGADANSLAFGSALWEQAGSSRTRAAAAGLSSLSLVRPSPLTTSLASSSSSSTYASAFLYLALFDHRAPALFLARPAPLRGPLATHPSSFILAASLVILTVTVQFPMLLLNAFAAILLAGKASASWAALAAVCLVISAADNIVLLGIIIAHVTGKGPLKTLAPVVVDVAGGGRGTAAGVGAGGGGAKAVPPRAATETVEAAASTASASEASGTAVLVDVGGAPRPVESAPPGGLPSAAEGGPPGPLLLVASHAAAQSAAGSTSARSTAEENRSVRVALSRRGRLAPSTAGSGQGSGTGGGRAGDGVPFPPAPYGAHAAAPASIASAATTLFVVNPFSSAVGGGGRGDYSATAEETDEEEEEDGADSSASGNDEGSAAPARRARGRPTRSVFSAETEDSGIHTPRVVARSVAGPASLSGTTDS
jgi:hypothetical protein